MKMSVVKCFFLALSFAAYVACAPPEYFNIGLMFPIANDDGTVSDGVKYIAAMEMVIDEINDKTDGVYDDILPHTELRMVVRSPMSAFSKGAEAAQEMVSIDDEKGVIGCVGPAGLSAMKGTAPVFDEAGGIPLIGYSSRSAILGDGRIYPNHLRTMPALYSDGTVIADILGDFMGWKKVTLFSTSDDYGSMSSFLFKEQAALKGIEILSSHTFLVNKEDLSSEINDAKKAGARIFVLLMTGNDAVNLAMQGTKLGLFNKNTQLIGGENIFASASSVPAGQFPESIPGIIGVQWKQGNVFTSSHLTSFIQRWKSRTNTDGSPGACDTRMDYYNDFYLHQFQPLGNTSAPYTCAGLNFSSYRDDGTDLVDAMQAYDAVMSLALALHHIVDTEGVCDPTPSRVMEVLLHDVNFEGLTGNLSYSSKYQNQFFDVGGRDSEYVYTILNIVNDNGNLIVPGVAEWNSVSGFLTCDGTNKYSQACHHFMFPTKHGSKPTDSPPVYIRHMNMYYRVPIALFSIAGLLMATTVLVTVLVFQQRRICRMAQPYMISISCVGLILLCIRAFLASMHLSAASCNVEFWAGHLGFILVMTTIGVKSWRVYMVTNAMKKVRVEEYKCVIIVGVIVLLSGVIMVVQSAIGNIHKSRVIIVQDQFEYTKEEKCVADNKDAELALNVFEILIVAFAARMLWFTRKVASTISSTAVSATAVINACVAILFAYIVLELIEFDPYPRQFFVALVIILLTIRVTWILYSQLVMDVLLGYELDKALQRKKTAWSVTNISICHHASKILGDDKPASTLSSTSDAYDESYTKAMAKFSKSKNAGELQFEIDKIRKEIECRQSELACLENMKFASNNSGNSSSSHKNSSHNESAHNESPDNESGRIGKF